MDIVSKKRAFEYLLTQMLHWGDNLFPVVSRSSFTRLKALKLLFFAAAVKNESGEDLLDIFDNFYALPNGPVESDIYNSITSDNLTYYTFRNFSFSAICPYSDKDVDQSIKERIDVAIVCLRQKNNHLVRYSAEELVSLSHIWMVWKNSIQIARAFGKGSYRMTTNKIRSNNQFFVL